MGTSLGERTIEQLRDTHVVRWSAAYCASAWLTLQVLDLLSDSFAWPDPLRRPVATVAPFGLMAVWGARGRR